MGQGRKALCAVVSFHLVSVTGSYFIAWAIVKLTSNPGWLWTHYLAQDLNLGWSFWLRLLRHGILSLLISSDITWIYRFWTIFSWYSILSRLFLLSLNSQNKKQRNRQMFRASKGNRDSPNGTWRTPRHDVTTRSGSLLRHSLRDAQVTHGLLPEITKWNPRIFRFWIFLANCNHLLSLRMNRNHLLNDKAESAVVWGKKSAGISVKKVRSGKPVRHTC